MINKKDYTEEMKNARSALKTTFLVVEVMFIITATLMLMLLIWPKTTYFMLGISLICVIYSYRLVGKIKRKQNFEELLSEEENEENKSSK